MASTESRWLIKVRGQSRECRHEGSDFVHVLNSGWRINERDPEIQEIKSCGVAIEED